MISSLLENVSCENNIFHLKGFAYIVGHELPDYGYASFIIVAKSDSYECSFKVGSFKRADKKMIEGLNYLCSGVTDYRGVGVDLTRLPFGIYKLFVSVTMRASGLQETSSLFLKGSETKALITQNSVVKVINCNNGAYLVNLNPISKYRSNYFKIRKCTRSRSRLHYEGDFIVYGQSVVNYSDIDFVLIIVDHNIHNNIVMMQYLGKEKIQHFKCEDIDGFYEASHFSTIGLKGIDISAIKDGEYDIYISMIKESYIWTEFVETVIFNKENIDVINN